MNRKKELARNTAILTVGRLCTQFISFFLLPLYTAVLATHEYGTYDVMITYAALLLPLVNWQFDQGLFRFMLDDRGDREKLSELFTTLLLSSVMQCCLYAVVFFLVRPFLRMDYKEFLLVYVILHVFTALLLQFVRGLGNSVQYAVASFISASATTVLNVIMLVVLKMGLPGLFISTVLAQILTLVYLVAASGCIGYFSPDRVRLPLLKTVGAYSLPLIPNNLAWWVVNASDRMVINVFLGAAANGIYSVANKFPGVFIRFYNILNLSWTETVSLHYQDEDRDEFFSETMTSLFKLFACGCFCIVAMMPFAFPVLVNIRYEAAYNQIPILMYAMIFRVLVGLYSCIYVAEKNAKKIAFTSIAAAVINLTVDLLFIRKIHVYAASVSTLVAFLTMFIFRYFDVNKTVTMKIRRPVVLWSLCFGVLNLGSYYCGRKIVQLIVLAATLVYSVVMNLDMAASGVRLIKSRFGSLHSSRKGGEDDEQN